MKVSKPVLKTLVGSIHTQCANQANFQGDAGKNQKRSHENSFSQRPNLLEQERGDGTVDDTRNQCHRNRKY